MIRGSAAASGDPVIADAARAAFEEGGSAVDALVAGFLAAAAVRPGALLAPCVALVAGVGVGIKAFDGRALQAGRGGARPRGFVEGATIPAAARVAVPRSLAMLALLHGYRGRSRLGSLAVAAARVASAEGAKARASVIRAFGERGALALRRSDVAEALVAAGGPTAGGILTVQDLEEAVPDQSAAASMLDTRVHGIPWSSEGLAEDQLAVEGIVAVDAHGLFGALCYAPAREGIAVSELEVALGLHGEPVRRGVPRVAPGTPIPAPAPIAVITRDGLSAAVFKPGAVALSEGEARLLAESLPFDTEAKRLGFLGVTWDGRVPRALGG